MNSTVLPGEYARPFRLWPYLLVNLAAAIWLDFTTFHQLQTSDSIIFVLSSLYELRPFFWEQDRVGMLVPILASWCHNPLVNLLLQSGTTIFIGLTFPILLARVLTPHRMAPLAITFTNAAFVWLAPDMLHENWLLACNYPSGLFFGLLAISLLDRRTPGKKRWAALRIAWAMAFFLVASWQYYGAILFLGPLIVFRAWAKTGPGAPLHQPRRQWSGAVGGASRCGRSSIPAAFSAH